MTAYPPLPAPHPVRHKLFVNGRFVAACDCHMGTPLTKAGELPRRAHLVAVS